MSVPDFAERAAKARHRVAHPTRYDDEGSDMYFLACGLEWAVRHCLLLELGFDESAAAKVVLDSGAFQRDIRNIDYFLANPS